MTSYIPPLDVRKHRLQSVLDAVLKAQSPLVSPNSTRTPELLHWDAESGSLKIWGWPCFTDGRRVPPDELEQHRREYYFRAPCCLCTSTDAMSRYKESKFQLLESINATHNVPRNRPFFGEYIAECATGACGYFVLVERFYAEKTLMVKYYGKRLKPHNPNALNFLRESEEHPDERLSCGFRRIFIGTEIGNGFARGVNKLKRCHKECNEAEDGSVKALLALVAEGVPEAQFWSLFIQCSPRVGKAFEWTSYLLTCHGMYRSDLYASDMNSAVILIETPTAEGRQGVVNYDPVMTGLPLTGVKRFGFLSKANSMLLPYRSVYCKGEVALGPGVQSTCAKYCAETGVTKKQARRRAR
ncbi:hypothetical protein NMY22_g16944 [Coprinellus aureogranulatus]|nr:hypothetical protein NMY22_g16944 [Coprinellus aureogranulatus]